MAEKPKAARKAPAKRGPTKAAALKALGLTQEDLDAVKELQRLRSEVQELSERDAVAIVPTYTPEAEEVADERKDHGWSAAAPQAVPMTNPAPSGDPVFYMRNLRGVEVAFRLSRQEDSKKRTVLKPRGMRGDLQKLSPEDLNDAELRTQAAYQLVEIIPEGEAMRVIEQQAVNAQQPGARPIEAMLTNAKGEALGENPVQVAPEFNSQGTVVAHLNPQQNSPTGELPSKGKGIDWQAARGGVVQTAPVQPGVGAGTGPIVQDGNPNRAAAARDAVARRKGGKEGPAAAGMEGMNVSVEAPVKT
jgi:hypothetical protein